MAERALATAFVNIVPGTVALDRYLKTGIGSQMAASGAVAGDKFAKGTSQGFASKIKGYFGPIAASFAASFAVIGVTQFAKEAITLASDFAEQGAAVSQVFGNAAADINKFAADGALALGQSKVQILEAAKSFGIYGKAAGLAGEDNAKFSTDLVTLATDLASFNNTSVEEAIQAIGSGLRGEAEPLRRFGVLLDDAALKAQAMKMKIYDGNGSLTQQQKVLAANAAIFEQTSTQQGDFARTSAGLANQQRILAAQFDNIKISVGEAFLPAMTSVVTFLNTSVLPAISGFIDQLKGFAATGDFFGALFKNVTKSVEKFFTGGGLQSFVEKILALRNQLINSITNSLPDIITTLVNVVVNAIPVLINSMLATIPVLVQALQRVLLALVGALSTTIPQAIQSIIRTLAAALPQVFEALVAAIPVLLATAQRVFEALVQAVITTVPKVITALVNMLPRLVQTITGMIPGIIQAAINLFLGLLQGLATAIPKLLVALLNALPKIVKAIATMLPAVLTGAIQLFLGLVNGLVKVIPQLLTTFTDVVLPKLIQTIVKLIPVLIPAAVKLFLALVDGLTKALPTIISAVVKLVPEIVKALLKALPLLIDAGLQIITGIVKGIWDNAPTLIGGVMEDVGNLAINSFKSVLGIASPSKVFKVFGKNIIQGLNKGLTGSLSSIESTMDKVREKITKAFEDKKISQETARAARALVSGYEQALTKISKELDDVREKIDKAQDELNERIQEKVDYINGVLGQYGATLTLENVVRDPLAMAEAQNKLNAAQARYNELLKDTEASATDVEGARLDVLAAERDLAQVSKGGTTASDAVKQLQDRIAKSKELRALTQQLIDLGLDKDLIRQIVESQAVDFAKSVIAGGKAAVKELNVLADEANEQARKLGEQVGAVLYDKGIEFAKSVVKGLEDRETELKNLMERVAKEFGENLKRVLAGLDIDTPALNEGKDDGGDGSAGQGSSGGVGPKRRGSGRVAWQMMAAGGYVEGPTPAIIGEAGPEVVTPLKDFERMMGISNGSAQTINYYAAPNQSIDSEQALFQAMRRAKVISGW